MPKKSAAEFSWLEGTQRYRKRVKNPYTGKWYDVYGKTKDETRANVKEMLAKWAALADAETDPYVHEYCKTWYQLNTTDLSDGSRDGIANCINNHICPIIGGLRIRDVRQDDIKSVMAACAAMSNETQKKILNVLKRVFNSACKNKIIDDNPTDGITAKGRKTEEKVPLSREQQERLTAALEGTRCHAFVMLCLYAGLRREEALGLCWDCVHLDAETPYIQVRRVLTWQNNRPVVSTTLKSAAAKRNLPLPPQLVKCLASLGHSASGHVVADTSGQPMSQSSFKNMWAAIEARSERTVYVKDHGRRVEQQLHIGDKVNHTNIYVSLDFGVTPHQLRHTYITELILAGANIKTVQYLAGHSSVQLTLKVYAHLVDNQPCFTKAAVLSAFGPKPQGVKQGVSGQDTEPQTVDITALA